MAKKKKGVELFELLAERAAESKPRGFVSAPEVGSASLPEKPAARLTGKEIILGLDSAFVIFVGVVIILFCVYRIAYQKGLAEQKLPVVSVGVEKAGGAEALTGIEGRNPVPPLKLDGDEYVIKLRTSRNHSSAELKRMRVDLAYVKQVLREKHSDDGAAVALLFDNGQVYSVAAGLCKERNDPLLSGIKKLFGDADGPATSGAKPYKGCVPAQAGTLGELVEE